MTTEIPHHSVFGRLTAALWSHGVWSSLQRCCWRLTPLPFKSAPVRSPMVKPSLHSRAPPVQSPPPPASQSSPFQGKISRCVQCLSVQTGVCWTEGMKEATSLPSSPRVKVWPLGLYARPTSLGASLTCVIPGSRIMILDSLIPGFLARRPGY